MDVIRKIRKLTKIQKVGHAGTLDPLATGVLLVCIGNYTKKIESLMNQSKEYTATINLEAFSSTDDAQGQLTSVATQKIPSKEDVATTLNSFVGTIDQTPPKVSAIMVDGVRAYKRAANNEDFQMKSRQVTVYSLDLIDYSWPNLQIKVHCSKGTYIRTIAKDIGQKLSTGGYITKLERTAIGEYLLDQALNIDVLNEIKDSDLKLLI